MPKFRDRDIWADFNRFKSDKNMIKQTPYPVGRLKITGSETAQMV